MAERRHLKNAPIVEALVDLQTSLPEDFDIERFHQLHDQLKSEFPTSEPQFRQQMMFMANEGQVVTHAAPPKPRGYLFRSADRLTVAQFRRDGFTVNRLRPYVDWPSLRSQALELWQLYCSVASPLLWTRVALRYINQIEIPTAADLEEYLTAPPTIPTGAPEFLTEFFTRVVLTDSDESVAAAITHASAPALRTNTALVVLDIDVYRVAQGGIATDEVVPTLEKLRTLKNDIFFDSLTDTALDRYV